MTPSTNDKNVASHRDHVVTYTIVALIVAGVAVAGVLTFSYKRQSAQADEKAAQLQQRWAELGLKSTLGRSSIVRLYGTDGGAVCDTSSRDLSQALLRTALANGAAGPGQRPVVVDRKLLEGERAVVEVYCPDKLSDFDSFANDLKYAHVTGDD
jgi:hypothetical protein